MKRALLLSGGAFRGAVQVPVIDKLIKEHEYDAVYGVSVGSINGAMFAQDSMEELWDFWNSIDGKSGFLKMKWYWPFNGLYSLSPLRAKMEGALSLDKLKTKYYAGVVSGTDGEYYSLCSDDMTENKELWDAIQASSCMAGIMEPEYFWLDGKKHIGFDGGYRNIIPVPVEKFDHLDVVTCTPLDRMKMKGEVESVSFLKILTRGIEIFQDEIFDRDINQLKRRGKSVTVYYPHEYPGNSLDCKRDDILRRFELGEHAYLNPLKLKG